MKVDWKDARIIYRQAVKLLNSKQEQGRYVEPPKGGCYVRLPLYQEQHIHDGRGKAVQKYLLSTLPGKRATRHMY